MARVFTGGKSIDSARDMHRIDTLMQWAAVYWSVSLRRTKGTTIRCAPRMATASDRTRVRVSSTGILPSSEAIRWIHSTASASSSMKNVSSRETSVVSIPRVPNRAWRQTRSSSSSGSSSASCPSAATREASARRTESNSSRRTPREISSRWTSTEASRSLQGQLSMPSRGTSRWTTRSGRKEKVAWGSASRSRASFSYASSAAPSRVGWSTP